MKALYILAALLVTTPAAAQTYVKGELWMANLSAFNEENLCGAVGVGHEFDWFRLEAEASCHKHLGITKYALTGMAYAEPWTFGRFTPYAGIGFGATSDEPVYQGALGVSVDVGIPLTLGIVHRCYDSHCNSRDDAAMIGFRLPLNAD